MFLNYFLLIKTNIKTIQSYFDIDEKTSRKK